MGREELPAEVRGRLDGYGVLPALGRALIAHQRHAATMPLTPTEVAHAASVVSDLSNTLKAVLHV
jgi:hypothetical protein